MAARFPGPITGLSHCSSHCNNLLATTIIMNHASDKSDTFSASAGCFDGYTKRTRIKPLSSYRKSFLPAVLFVTYEFGLPAAQAAAARPASERHREAKTGVFLSGAGDLYFAARRSMRHFLYSRKFFRCFVVISSTIIRPPAK
jgi:hypothetical protein